MNNKNNDDIIKILIDKNNYLIAEIDELKSQLELSKGKNESLQFIIDKYFNKSEPTFPIDPTVLVEPTVEVTVPTVLVEPTVPTVLVEPTVPTVLVEPIDNFNVLLQEFNQNKNDEILNKLFNNFKSKYNLILTKCYNYENLEYFINKYNLNDEYDIIKQSKYYIENDCKINESINTLKEKINNENKIDSINYYITEFLYRYPLMFNDECYNIIKSKKKSEDILIFVYKMKMNLYKSNVILITNDEINRKCFRFDHHTVNIKLLVSYMEIHYSKNKQVKILCKNRIESLLSCKRKISEIEEFIKGVNKFLKSKININEYTL